MDRVWRWIDRAAGRLVFLLIGAVILGAVIAVAMYVIKKTTGE